MKFENVANDFILKLVNLAYIHEEMINIQEKYVIVQLQLAVFPFSLIKIQRLFMGLEDFNCIRRLLVWVAEKVPNKSVN